MKTLNHRLQNSKKLLIVWSFIAAFGTYFCMYAFRKSFNAGQYSGLEMMGMPFKSVLIISQVLGYMISKFIGIKVISELQKTHRIYLIISLIIISEIALLGFGSVARPYNFIFLFFNGLPLGMVWGIIFSFLEGRKITEFIVTGLSLNLIVGSGFLKTIYFKVYQNFDVNEFWMPALIGGIFLPFFLIFVWMLSKIPNPTLQDEQERTLRKQMTKADKKNVLRDYGFGFFFMVTIYAIITTIREFRDNFYVEICNELGGLQNRESYAMNEFIIGIIILVFMVSVGYVRENKRAFNYIFCLIIIGVLLSSIATILFENKMINGQNWMILLGIALFLPYLLIQTLYFDRMIALFKIKANTGFFVYICDSIGYFGSVFLMFYKELFLAELSWVLILKQLSYGFTYIALVCLVFIRISFKNHNYLSGRVLGAKTRNFR